MIYRQQERETNDMTEIDEIRSGSAVQQTQGRPVGQLRPARDAEPNTINFEYFWVDLYVFENVSRVRWRKVLSFEMKPC